MRIAWELNKTEEEVREMSVEEFSRWGAFLDIIHTSSKAGRQL